MVLRGRPRGRVGRRPFLCFILFFSMRAILEDWEAVPLAAPLLEARNVKRPWSPTRVPGHWQLEEAFAAYEGYVLYRCRFEGRLPSTDEAVFLRFGGVYYS